MEVKKFSGRIQEWQKFWDSFESAIDKNESLAAVDKFAYLRSLVVETGRSTIAGFSLTSANYTAAVEVLKKRYGEKSAIQRAHVNDLLNLPHVLNDRDTPRLRKLYDSCETHFRGLKALSVNEDTYSAVVVPAVLHKLYCSIVRSVLEYACPVWAALPKYLGDAIESVQKRALRIILPNCHYDDALIQSGITALSQRREEACTNCIKRDCLSSAVLKPLIPRVSIDRPYCLLSGERVPVGQSTTQISAPLSIKTSCNPFLSYVFSVI